MSSTSAMPVRGAEVDMLMEVRDLEVSYGGGIRALQGVSLHVKPGELVALVGANGAGKTTLMKTVVGLLRAAGGGVYFDGKSIDTIEGSDRVRLGIALVPEGRQIFSRLTVTENLMLGAYTNRNPGFRREMLEQVYSLFPILRERSKQRAGTFSGGEQQMLAIARALMSKPKLLLLDEPSLGIMPMLVDQIMDVLRQLHQEQGLSMLLVEQNVPAALSLADRGYVMQTGQIVMEADAKELLGSDLVRKAYLGI
jgi:branched-chain amino acid transport system ATP-binding protein